MSRRQFFRFTILALTAIGLWISSVAIAHAQMKCYYNPDVQCQACAGKIGDQCCNTYSCADGSGEVSCGPCSQARMRSGKPYIFTCGANVPNEVKRPHIGDAILLSHLPARDIELEHALRSLR